MQFDERAWQESKSPMHFKAKTHCHYTPTVQTLHPLSADPEGQQDDIYAKSEKDLYTWALKAMFRTSETIP